MSTKTELQQAQSDLRVAIASREFARLAIKTCVWDTIRGATPTVAHLSKAIADLEAQAVAVAAAQACVQLNGGELKE